jgi:hypothetical protein
MKEVSVWIHVIETTANMSLLRSLTVVLRKEKFYDLPPDPTASWVTPLDFTSKCGIEASMDTLKSHMLA